MPARSINRLVAVMAAAALTLTACANNEGGGGGGAAASKDLIVSTDLPLQGSRTRPTATNKRSSSTWSRSAARPASTTIELKKYDDSTAAKGAWDDATCAKNASDHVANANEVAVMGTYNSGCAKIEVPVLNQDPHRPDADGVARQHQPRPDQDVGPGRAGEVLPDRQAQLRPRRHHRRLPGRGRRRSSPSKDLKVKKCFVLNDNQTYGQGVAKAFADEAKKQGIEIVGNEPWDAKQPNYTALFQQIKATGADCVFLGGIYDNNGGQLVKDKVKVLGDNDEGQADRPGRLHRLPGLPEAAGGRGHVPDLRRPRHRPAAQGRRRPAPSSSTPTRPSTARTRRTSYALYGVPAVQVILAAIEKSDGTRKGVSDAVFRAPASPSRRPSRSSARRSRSTRRPVT